jgi:hypothetical protein
MTPNSFWVHKEFKDVMCEVLRVYRVNPRYMKVKVRWWNRGFTGNPWIIDYKPQTLKIPYQTVKDWYPYAGS